MRHAAFRDVPFLLEVPGIDGGARIAENVMRLKAIRAGIGLAAPVAAAAGAGVGSNRTYGRRHPPGSDHHVNRAWDWFAGMVALSATNLGVELGIFERLRTAARPIAGRDRRRSSGLVPRAVDLWAKTLVHYELLEDAGGGRVAMAPGLELMVCEPVTLFNLQPSLTYHARFLARDFLDLADFFRDGVPRPPGRHGAALRRTSRGRQR